MNTESIPNHITRDVVEFNKQRGKYCGELYKKYGIMKHIHHASYITQINNVPQNSICMIDNKKIPTDTAGVQLIVHGDTVKNLIVQKKHLKKCYYYFKIRYFDDLVKKKIIDWLTSEDWFYPRLYTINYILKKILQSNFSDGVLTELTEILD
jgi:hypothetical protein